MARLPRPAAVGGVALLALAGPVVGAAPGASAAGSAAWQLGFLHAADANRISTGKGVVIGLVDTPVDTSVPELRGRVREGLRLDGAKTPSADPHGTGMADLMVGSGARSGLRGLAPGATVLSVGTASTVQAGVNEQEAYGIGWAAKHHVGVLNLSFGEGVCTLVIREAVKAAVAADVVVVAAAGNRTQGDRGVDCPARLPGVIAVTAVDQRGRFSQVSVHGPEAVLAAPGVDMTVVGPGGRLFKGSGTSASTALVSATAALVRAKYPRLKAPDVIARLVQTADDAGAKGRDPEYGFGIVDPVRALTADVPHVATNPLLSGQSAVQTSSPATAPAASAAASGGTSSAAAASAAPTSSGTAADAPAPGATAAAAAPTSSGAGTSTGLLVGLGALVVVLAAGLGSLLAVRRRGSAPRR
ncbi:subtilisin family serine protease [Motilibacter rhizosphaerae]|uniref:Subtilisin family serine protease n=1 Tax=Motilibacter rhizosphaerae TaxID=598652 RepID=A0A4V2F4S8_9ACTN|nr:S8 family serine peptidase [Motilibacter rhizosphaerae]RZS90369.1 subtilisin family serine protease [Motilibacter rhizosphaerae]